MLRQLSIALAAAGLFAAMIAVFTWPGEAQQRAPRASFSGEEATTAAPIHVVNNSPRYDAGMRIIHVPQQGEVASYPVTTDGVTDDDVEMTVPRKPARKRVVMPAPPQQPKRILPPPASGPKRSVLSAPPPLADGPSPIRPLPRWRSSEKFTMPTAPVVTNPTPADAVTATIPAETTTTPLDPPDMPAIDDDTPPPTD